MQKILCFGELLLRLSPVLKGEWIKQNAMPVFIGGAELNVAQALAIWNIPVSYFTALPDHYLSHEIIEFIGAKGIDTSRIQLSGNRIGTYYLPQGADLKHAGVIYDRAYSSFYELKPKEIDWDIVLKDISWFNISAISPALNSDLAQICKEGAEAASKKGITVSIDLNYRAKLWQYGKQPSDVLPEIVQYCDIIMGNIWAVEKMLGIPLPSEITNDKSFYVTQSQKTSEEVLKHFPKCKQVANTFRFDHEKGIRYYATLFTKNAFHISNEYTTANVIDRVGSGDAFMAALIYGNCQKWQAQEIIEFAASAAFNKLFIKGDTIDISVENIKRNIHLAAKDGF